MIVSTIIQIVLLLAILGLMFFFVTNRRKARAKAGVKIGFLLFVIGCVWAVIRPDDLTVVANWLGVDRGTDLLLYLVTLAFLFVTVSTYIRFREQELRYARLARAVALSNAVPPEAELPVDVIADTTLDDAPATHDADAASRD